MQSMLAFGVRVCVNTFRVFVHRTSLFSNIVIVFESGNSAADMMVILRIRFHGCAAPFNMHNRKLIRPLLSAQSNAQFVSQRSLKSEKKLHSYTVQTVFESVQDYCRSFFVKNISRKHVSNLKIFPFPETIRLS